jgi:hypothetical protein
MQGETNLHSVLTAGEKIYGQTGKQAKTFKHAM